MKENKEKRRPLCAEASLFPEIKRGGIP